MSPISKYTKYHNFPIKARSTKDFPESCQHILSGIFIRSQFRVLFQFKDMGNPPKKKNSFGGKKSSLKCLKTIYKRSFLIESFTESFGHSGVKIRKNHLMPIYIQF